MLVKKTIYLRNKKGEDIAEEQNRLNAEPNMYVVATQIFLVNDPKDYVPLYDAFIYVQINTQVS